MLLEAFRHVSCWLKGFVPFELFREPIDLSLELLQIRQNQFRVDRVDVVAWRRGGVDVDHVSVIETAHHMHDGGGLSDVTEKLVSEPFPPACTVDQSGYVEKLDGRLDGLLRLNEGH